MFIEVGGREERGYSRNKTINKEKVIEEGRGGQREEGVEDVWSVIILQL